MSTTCNVKIGTIVRKGKSDLELRCHQKLNGDKIYCSECHQGPAKFDFNLVFSNEDVARAVEETKREEAQSLEWERINRPEVYAAIQAANARYAREYSDSE